MSVRSYHILAGAVLFTTAFLAIVTRINARDEIANVPGSHAQYRPFVSAAKLRSPIAPAKRAIPNPLAVNTDGSSMLADLRKWVDQHAVLNRDAEGEFLALYSNIEMDPEAVAYAEELAINVDPARRRLGFLLLQRVSIPTAEVHELLVQSLTTEQNPTVLSQVILALGRAVPPPDETGAVVVPLRYLVDHADATVRAASVEMLALWDTPATAEVTLYRGLMDPAREVRLAAVTTVAASGIHSERLKATLLDMARDPNESLAVKANALTTLNTSFSLSDDEVASYQKSRQEVATLPKGSDFAP